MFTKKTEEICPFLELKETVERLRGEDGCPWDRAQSHGSLKKFFIEETIEVILAVDLYEKTGNDENLCEELGDLLYLILLQSRIFEQEGRFGIEDVIKGIDKKMKHRHPKIFSKDDEKEVSKTWSELKNEEQEGKIHLTEEAKVLQKNLAEEIYEIFEKYKNVTVQP